MERFLCALNFGADAVYLGGTSFGMRASPSNFTFEELRTAVSMAHSRGVKVYFTLNVIPKGTEIDKLPEFIQIAADCGVDAFIVTDLGVLSMIKKYAPNVEIHISTQAGIVNHAAANMFYELGANRVVTARELSIEDIAELRAKTNKKLQIECFVHGAICVSFSGRCLLSNYLVGRDANNGECAQPCRWKYNLVEESRPNRYFPINQDEGGTYIMNSRDMCMIEHIPELVKAGIDSFKIEGRAKSAYYTAVITNAYRCAIDGYLANPSDDYKAEPWIVEETKKVSYREYCTGFYFGHPIEDAQIFYDGGYVREWDVAAIVEGYQDGFLIVSQRNRFFKGDELEVLEPHEKPFMINTQEIYDAQGEPIEVAPHPIMTVKIKCDTPIKAGSILRKKQMKG